MTIKLGNKTINLDARTACDQGGEAYIYKYGRHLALKIFKRPDDPQFEHEPLMQQRVARQLAEHQQKLRQFPKGLPHSVIAPAILAYDQAGSEIMGYAMRFVQNSQPLFQYSQRSFRDKGVDPNLVVRIFRNLHALVSGIHKAGPVIGDFNNLNVLVTGETPWIIDADSFQFGRFYSRMFTPRYVDPLLCNPAARSPELTGLYVANSDWYSFAVMLFECLLLTSPYGGIYKPADPGKLIPHDQRPLARITVCNSEVRYPKPAIPYKVLGDDLLQQFHLILEKDQRGIFPLKLLDSLQWTKCSTCGTEHARPQCPNCQTAAPAQATKVTVISGQVVSRLVFKTRGTILCSAYQDRLRFLYHENGSYKRDESGTEILQGPLDPHVRYRVQLSKTHMAKAGSLVTLQPGGQVLARRAVDSYSNLPMFDSNQQHLFWLEGGRLMKEGPLGPEFPETIGEALAGQTLFWVGPNFGFGFYRAGSLTVGFTFNTASSGINDSVPLPKISGQLVDSTCVFAKDRVWFLVATQEAGQIKHQCFVISSSGLLLAKAEAKAGDAGWLGTIRGKAAAGNFLFAATDDGLVRLEIQNGQIVQTRNFADTESFVNSSSQLFVAKEGIYIVDRHEIHLLQIHAN